MKKLLSILPILFFLSGFSQTYTIKDTTFVTWNARVAYISGVTDSTECIITFLGAGEEGTDTTKLGLFGPAYYMQHTGWNGKIHLGNGDHYPIYITLQCPNQSQKPPAVLTRVNAILARFPLIKKNALFMTGYSNGGWQSLEFTSYQPTSGDHSYNKMVHAVLGIESVKPANIFDGTPAYPTNMTQWAQQGGNVLGFDQDGDAGRDMQTYCVAMNGAVAGSANRIVTHSDGGGHCCFNDFYDPTDSNWTATNPIVVSLGTGSYQSMTVYQWLLRHGDTTFYNGQTPPTVTGGGGTTLTLPTNSTGITSSASGGTSPYTYSWTKFSGPTTFTINTPTTQNTTVSNLVAGTYDFRITVTDNDGLQGSDDVIVIVNNGANTPPVANAGTDQVITLPTSTVTLDGSASYDPDGTISTYSWLQISGNTVNIVSPSQAITVVNNFTQAGTYLFSLTVTDNSGASTSDTVQVTVNPNNTGTAITAEIYLYGGTNGCPVTGGLNAWNDSSGMTFNNIVDINGSLTAWTAALSSQTSIVDNGATYGNGQPNLIAPQCQLRHASYASSTARTITIGNLSTSALYTITIIGSRSSGTANNMINVIGSNSQSLQTSDNYTTSLVFPNVAPNASGVIKDSIYRQTGSAGTYINKIIITQQGSNQNTNPTAFAGPNQVIALPQDSTIVSGVGSDPDQDDSVVGYNWQFLSGPRLDTVVIDSPNRATTYIHNMVVGTYLVLFTVTDTHGGQGADTLQITVTSSSGAVSIAAMKDTVLAYSQVGGHGNELLRDTTQIVLKCQSAPNVTAFKWRQLTGGAVTIALSTSQNTNSYGYTPGNYSFEIKGSNLTDSAKDTVNIKVLDYQTRNQHGCRVGSPVTHTINATSTNALIKTNLWQTQAAIGDTILGGDTIKITPNPNNGGIYTILTIAGVSGQQACPLYITSDTVINVQGSVRFGNGNDSAGLGFAKLIFTHPKKAPNVLYGLANDPPTYNAANNGFVMNITANVEVRGVYVHRMGIGSFCKNNADSTHAPQTFNKFRFFKIEVDSCMVDSSGAEAIYYGNTSPDGHAGAGGDGPSVRVDTVLFHHNIIQYAGYDGGQFVNCVYLENHDNWYLYTGRSNATSQRFCTILGANTRGLIYNNFGYSMKEGFSGTPYGLNTYQHNFVDSCYTGQTGSLRSHGITAYGAAAGTAPGSTIVENRDSATIYAINNLVMNCDSFYIRIHNQNNYNSTLIPSLITNNYLVDTTGRILTQLITNSSGSIYNTGNLLFHTFPVQIVNLSSRSSGPLVQITQGADTQTFSDANAAITWLMNRLVPPVITNCNCLQPIVGSIIYKQ